MSFIWIAFIFSGILLHIGRCRIDETLEENATGAHVAKAAIRKLQDSCIFPNDRQFLTRLAYVEIHLSNQAHVRKEGIWGLSKGNFDKIAVFKRQDPSKYRYVVKEIKEKFKIDIERLSWERGDLNIPFHALLAARVVLDFVLKDDIPFMVEKQAKFWQHYKGVPTEQPFLQQMSSMRPACRSAGADILFVLDSSGSICDCTSMSMGACTACENYMKMFTLVKTVVRSLPYHANEQYQFAVDVFSTDVEHSIPFNSYTDINTLLKKIDQVPYLASTTGTDKALKEAVKISFGKQNGARDDSLGFPKVMVLVTDGESNEPSLTDIAAAEAKKAGIEIFTVGIGRAFTKQSGALELRATASRPKCMHMYMVEDFESLLAGFGDEIKSQTCHASAKSFGNQSIILMSVSPQMRKYFKFTVNTNKGAFLRFSCSKGSAAMYLSTIENPDGALYDYKLTANKTSEAKLYLSPQSCRKLQRDASSEQKKYSFDLLKRSSMLYLYASVVGHKADSQCRLGVFLKDPEESARKAQKTTTRRLKSYDFLPVTTPPTCNRAKPVCTCSCSCV